MPRVGRNSTIPTPCAGLSTPKTNPFDLLMSLRGNSDVDWDTSDSDDSESIYDSDDDTIASAMLPIFALGGRGKKKQKKKKGKGVTLAPTVKSLGGPSKLPVVDLGQKQQPTESEKLYTDKDEFLEMPHEVALELVRTAFIKAIDGHFAKLYLKIDTLKTNVLTLKTTVMSLV